MFIDIIPLQKNTARLTRVYGDAPSVNRRC